MRTAERDYVPFIVSHRGFSLQVSSIPPLEGTDCTVISKYARAYTHTHTGGLQRGNENKQPSGRRYALSYQDFTTDPVHLVHEPLLTVEVLKISVIGRTLLDSTRLPPTPPAPACGNPPKVWHTGRFIQNRYG